MEKSNVLKRIALIILIVLNIIALGFTGLSIIEAAKRVIHKQEEMNQIENIEYEENDEEATESVEVEEEIEESNEKNSFMDIIEQIKNKIFGSDKDNKEESENS